MIPTFEFKLAPGVKIPEYAHDGDAGIDLTAHILEMVTIYPCHTVRIDTGVSVRINDKNIFGALYSRSGMAANHQIRLGNCTGVIDSSYQKPIGVILHNDGNKPYDIHPGDKIAQLIFQPVIRPNIMFVDEFSQKTTRGGFGSSGR